MVKWDKEERARIRKVAAGTTTESEKVPKKKPQIRMLDEDADNLLKLSAALKILLSRTIMEHDLDRVKDLLYDYLDTFQKVTIYKLPTTPSTNLVFSCILKMSSLIITG